MPKIKFKNTGGKVGEEAQVEKGAELKEIAKEKGWPIAFGCGDGVCGVCIVKVTEGSENLSPIKEQEKQTLDIMGLNDGNHRLACQCKINGDVIIEGM